MFYSQRVVDIPDGKPKWTKLDNGEGSELIEDSPPEAINKRKRDLEEEEQKKQSGGGKGEKL